MNPPHRNKSLLSGATPPVTKTETQTSRIICHVVWLKMLQMSPASQTRLTQSTTKGRLYSLRKRVKEMTSGKRREPREDRRSSLPADSPLSDQSALRNRTWKCVILKVCGSCKRARCCDVRLHIKRCIKKQLLPTPLRFTYIRMCVCVCVCLCDPHTDLCLVTHLPPVCLIFSHEPASVCWTAWRGRKNLASGPSGVYDKILFCLGGQPEAVKSSMITCFLSVFICPALNLRAFYSNSWRYRL